MFEGISPHVYIKEPNGYSDRPTIGYIKGEKLSLLFESGASKYHNEEIRKDLELASLPYPSLVAISHWHWDHSFGLYEWNVPSIAGKETNNMLKKLSKLKWDEESIKERILKREEIVFCHEMMKREYGDTNTIKVVPASIEFEKELSIDLGGINLRLIHISGPHSRDSVVLYIPEEKIIFLADSHGKDLYTYPWHFDINEEEKFMEEVDKIPYDLIEKDRYLERLKSLDFSIAIPGHSGIMERDELFSLLS